MGEIRWLEFIWADGRPSREDIETMNREIPAYDEELRARGMRLLGRELDLPGTAVTVRGRGPGREALVIDGPFAETKEFIAGFDLLECDALDSLIEVTGRNPIARFHPMEIRPMLEGVTMTDAVSAFGRSEDGDGRPFLLATWATDAPDEPSLASAIDAWRRELGAPAGFIMGSALGDTETATTLYVRDGRPVRRDGSFSRTGELVVAVEVISAANRDVAVELAGRHPHARHHAIEVRPFYIEPE